MLLHIIHLIVTALVLVVETELSDAETHAAEFDDVAEGDVHPIVLLGIVLVLRVPDDEPCHLDVVLVGVILDGLVMEQPVVPVLICHAY